MINRRAFVKLGLVGLPLAAGCAGNPVSLSDDPVTAALTETKANLPAPVIDQARQYAAQMRSAQRIVADFNVPFDTEPRFFPSMT